MEPMTVWDEYFNKHRPPPEKVILEKDANRLAPGTHVMVMFQSSGEPFEFKIVVSSDGTLLEDVHNRQRMPASDVFTRLGYSSPFHVMWKVE